MFLRSRIFQIRPSTFAKSVRTFLSDEYRCTPAWNSRLNAAFMQKVRLEHFYYEIDQAFQQQGKINAIDVDIFVNKAAGITDESHLDEITELLQRLRSTEETTNTLDSTGHAVIRNLIDGGHIKELLQILDNRLNFGVFLDHYSASYALNALIKSNDYKSAARIATFLMLQEDFDNELSRALSLYACYKYLEKPEPFHEVEEPADDGEKKEVKVRVKFLRNEFFDDHFDLKDHKHLIGKTLAAIGAKTDNQIGQNVQLIGFTLYQKYDKALNVLQSAGGSLYKDVIEICSRFIQESTEDSKAFNDFKSALENVALSKELNETNFEAQLKTIVETAVRTHEQTEIQKQNEVYKSWNELREATLNDEKQRLERAKRLQEIEKVAKEMEKEEQKLWFFENEDQIDLQIDSKKITYPKRWFGKKKKPRVVDESYIPPEIVKHRHNA